MASAAAGVLSVSKGAKSTATINDEELDAEEPEFINIDEIQKLGINASDISKLKAVNITTVGLVLSATSKELLAIKGISEAKVEKILEACKKLQPCSFVTGSEALLAHKKSRWRITTGSKELDSILGGGVETGNITEFFGEFRSGKTQIACTLAVTAQLGREHGGGAGKVIVLDSEQGFRPERVKEIAERKFGLDGDSVLDNLLIAKCYNHEHQMELLKYVAAKITEDESPYRLVIIDSIMFNFRVEFSGRGELAERQQKLGEHMRFLGMYAREFNIAIVLTNQVTADPGNMFVADAKKPIGGNILGHYADMRVYLRKGKGNQRIAKIYAGPVAEAEATFGISEAGVGEAD